MDLKPGRTQLSLQPGCVDVWHFECEPAAADVTRAMAWALSERECVTAARFRDEAERLRYLARHLTARAIVASYCGDSRLAIALRAGPHGKPYIAAPDSARRLRFSMAHSSTLCVLAIAAHCEVGVDVERVRGDVPLEDVARLSFTPRERAALRHLPEERRADAFYACWTRKEALLKAQGTGFLRPPETVHVGLGSYEVEEQAQAAGYGEGWAGASFVPTAGYVGAVALESATIELRVRPWRAGR